MLEDTLFKLHSKQTCTYTFVQRFKVYLKRFCIICIRRIYITLLLISQFNFLRRWSRSRWFYSEIPKYLYVIIDSFDIFKMPDILHDNYFYVDAALVLSINIHENSSLKWPTCSWNSKLEKSIFPMLALEFFRMFNLNFK